MTTQRKQTGDLPGLSGPPSPMAEALIAARKAVEIEAASLVSLASHIQVDLKPVVDFLSRTSGRIVVSGLGKSGHIGKKIAATFASTGTPSFFIHATEALHGDSGMCTDSDVALLISNSGETAEVCHFAASLGSRGIPVIAMTSGVSSTLSQNAMFTIPIRFEREAEPLDLVPTTSVVVTLALGDALAAALMTLSGFTSSDFSSFHPAGSLGQRLASPGGE